jgi:tryptophanyl-tRNA synthetase
MLGMVAKHSEVMRDPTLKTELVDQSDASMGFMYYPVDQIADIHMVDPMVPGAKLLVPVGKDQLPHLELAREVVRRFNSTYGQTFTECEGLVGKIGTLVGSDGSAKMSKSMGNTINLSDNLADVYRVVDRMSIDPARAVRGGDQISGDPDKSVAIIYHRALNLNENEVAEMENLYREASIGDAEIKARLKEVLRDTLTPIQERREHFRNANIADILQEGTLQAQMACKKVMWKVRERMHLEFPL